MSQQIISATLPILILGLGWTGQFLAELLVSLNIHYAATTRDGRVLITFPINDPAQLTVLMDKYEQQHGNTHWILLSSTRPFKGSPANRHTPLDRSTNSSRMPAEEELLKRGGTVLYLSGLWGGERDPKKWVHRFSSPEVIRSKLLARQLHLIHGVDVARAIVAVHHQFMAGERWIVSDNTCYDWIKLFLVWGTEEQVRIARDLAVNDPECHAVLGDHSLETIAKGQIVPRLDSTDFWDTFHLSPSHYLKIE
ncbi:hypothetical protein BDB01DRAFT_229526 [Pilobolus umbonatus]|nr:hypothetical protein BDB01DRAFT_229526 [Pilobolus umbonatus]